MLGVPGDRGLPAVARARDGLPARAARSTSPPPPRSPRAMVDRLDDVPLPARHAAQHQRARRASRRRRGRAAGQAHLPRRAGAGRGGGRAAGASASTATRRVHDDEPGTDLAAVAAGRIAVTPLHFDLTAEHGHGGAARATTSRALLAPAAEESRVSAPAEARARRRAARAARPTTATATTSSTTPRSATTPTTRCSTSCARIEAEHPELRHARLADPARRRRAGLQAREGHAPAADALARQRALGGGAARLGRADARPPRPRGDRGPGVRVRRRAEDRRAGDLAGLPRRRARARRHARQRRGRRGRHAQPAHDRARSRCAIEDAPPLLEVRGEVYMSLPRLRRAQRAPRRGRASRRS